MARTWRGVVTATKNLHQAVSLQSRRRRRGAAVQSQLDAKVAWLQNDLKDRQYRQKTAAAGVECSYKNMVVAAAFKARHSLFYTCALYGVQNICKYASKPHGNKDIILLHINPREVWQVCASNDKSCVRNFERRFASATDKDPADPVSAADCKFLFNIEPSQALHYTEFGCKQNADVIDDLLKKCDAAKSDALNLPRAELVTGILARTGSTLISEHSSGAAPKPKRLKAAELVVKLLSGLTLGERVEAMAAASPLPRSWFRAATSATDNDLAPDVPVRQSKVMSMNAQMNKVGDREFTRKGVYAIQCTQFNAAIGRRQAHLEAALKPLKIPRYRLRLMAQQDILALCLRLKQSALLLLTQRPQERLRATRTSASSSGSSGAARRSQT